jgi:uncharacterized protein (UPF0335 family)
MCDVVYAAIIFGAFILGIAFTVGAFTLRRAFNNLVGGTESVSTDITKLGEQERTITEGIRNSITTVSGMGADIQELNTVVEAIRKRNAEGKRTAKPKD